MEAEAVAGSTVGAAGTDDTPGATGPPGRDYSLESPTTKGLDEDEGTLNQLNRALDALDDKSPKTSTLEATTEDALAPLTTTTPVIDEKKELDIWPEYAKGKPKDTKDATPLTSKMTKDQIATMRAQLTAAARFTKMFSGPFAGLVPDIKNMTDEQVAELAKHQRDTFTAQEKEQEGLSTGEDDQKRLEGIAKVKEFRKTYAWTKDLSDEAVMAYVMDPNLLRLRLDNEKILDQIKATNEKPTMDSGISAQQTVWNPMAVYG